MSVIDSLKDQPKQRLAIIGVVVAAIVGVLAVVVFAGGDDDGEVGSPTTSEAPEDGPRVAPLTGLPGDHEGRLERPALVVKVDNVEPDARPQAGLNDADVVYEERVEGSVTRLVAIYHSEDAGPIGPIRSARSSDLGIFGPLHRPFYVWSGANPSFAALIRSSNIVDAGHDAVPEFYYRESGRRAPSNLMVTSTADLLELEAEASSPPPPLFEYRDDGDEPDGLLEVTRVRVVYGGQAGSAPVEYAWNGEGWERSQAGTPHVDAAGEVVAPANVVIQFTPYLDSDVNDQFGNPIREADLVGEGEVWVLTAGGLLEGTWRKDALEDVAVYTDASGGPLLLTPGRTWVALAETGGAERLG
jgi:hypothetical protein